MDTVGQIAINDRRERGIAERTLLNAVTRRREAGDMRREKQPARDENSSSLGQCLQPIVPLDQVIEGAKQQNDVERRVRDMQRSRIPRSALTKGVSDALESARSLHV